MCEDASGADWWCRLKRNAINHWKIKDLARRLGIHHAQAVGHCEALWHFTAQYAPAGDVGKCPDSAIADGCLWDRDPAEFTAALVQARLLDKTDGPARLIVHDWSEHCDDANHAGMARRGVWFADGTRPHLTRLTEAERTKANALLGVNAPKRLEAPQNACAAPSPALPSPALPCHARPGHEKIAAAPPAVPAAKPADPADVHQSRPSTTIIGDSESKTASTRDIGSKTPEHVANCWGKPYYGILFDPKAVAFVWLREERGEHIDRWKAAYPAVDIEQEIRRAAEWCAANPTNGRKSNYRKFLTDWMSRTQDRGGTRNGHQPNVIVSNADRRRAEKRAAEFTEPDAPIPIFGARKAHG